jgi:hypothetical protein
MPRLNNIVVAWTLRLRPRGGLIVAHCSLPRPEHRHRWICFCTAPPGPIESTRGRRTVSRFHSTARIPSPWPQRGDRGPTWSERLNLTYWRLAPRPTRNQGTIETDSWPGNPSTTLFIVRGSIINERGSNYVKR